MKKILFATLLLSSFFASANDEKYINQMTKNIEAIYKAKTPEEYLAAINALDRIANAEKTKWEPYYYASFGYILLATGEKDGGKKDAYLDLAKQGLDKASAILPNDSELIALEGFVHMIRVTVDPATRGPQYSMMAMQTFGKAVGLNPNNPRALSLMAQMQFGTAQFFNQQPTEACETAKRAASLFESEVSTPNSLLPRWGKEMNAGLVSTCK
jgi:hypothetical protein